MQVNSESFSIEKQREPQRTIHNVFVWIGKLLQIIIVRPDELLTEQEALVWQFEAIQTVLLMIDDNRCSTASWIKQNIFNIKLHIKAYSRSQFIFTRKRKL